jgi:peptide/nickel transport system permease protein
LYRYIATRVAEGVVVILCVMTLVFIVVRVLGDPTALLLPPGTSVADIAALRHNLGLDKPIAVQYVDFLLAAARGDFGTSFTQHRPAFEVVIERLPATAMLALTALAIGIVVGGTLGIAAARFEGSPVGTALMLPALIAQSTPIFWLGLVLIEVFAVSLRVLPTGGIGGPSHFILPSIALGAFTSAAVARLLRSSLVESLNEDYIRTAVAKGLKPRLVLFRHALRNALLPTLTMIGILAGELLGGAVITETVFAWPGVGLAIMDAIQTSDFAVAQAGVIVVGTIFVLINLAVDLTYAVVDPRIRLSVSK